MNEQSESRKSYLHSDNYLVTNLRNKSAYGDLWTRVYMCLATRRTHTRAHYNNRVATKATTYSQIRRRKVVLERTLEACRSLR